MKHLILALLLGLVLVPSAHADVTEYCPQTVDSTGDALLVDVAVSPADTVGVLVSNGTSLRFARRYGNTTFPLEPVTSVDGGWPDGKWSETGEFVAAHAGIGGLNVSTRSLSGSWNTEEVQTGEYAYVSLVLDGSVRYVVAKDVSSDELHFFVDFGSGWSAPEVVAFFGADNALTVDSGGVLHLVYSDGNDLFYRRYDGSWDPAVTVDTGIGGLFPSIDVDDDGRIGVAYRDNANQFLLYAEGVNNSWTTEDVYTAGNIGEYASVKLVNTVNGLVRLIGCHHPGLNRVYLFTKNQTAWNFQVVAENAEPGVSMDLLSDNQSVFAWTELGDAIVAAPCGDVASAVGDGLSVGGIRLSTHPNPGSVGGRISFAIDGVGDREVQLQVFDVAGRLVKHLYSGRLQGVNSVHWNGSDSAGNRVASGTYYYLLSSGNERAVGKLVVVK